MLTEKQKSVARLTFDVMRVRTGDNREALFAAVEAVLAMQPKPTGKVYQVTEDDAHRCSDVYYNTNSGSYLEDRRAALQDLCDRLGLTQEPTGAAERIAELEAEVVELRRAATALEKVHEGDLVLKDQEIEGWQSERNVARQDCEEAQTRIAELEAEQERLRDKLRTSGELRLAAEARVAELEALVADFRSSRNLWFEEQLSANRAHRKELDDARLEAMVLKADLFEARANAMTPEAKAVIDAALVFTPKDNGDFFKALQDLVDATVAYRAAQTKDADK